MIATRDRWTTKKKALKIRAIEHHLRNYKTYKAGIKNFEGS
ncbi:hypothetical protein [Caldalkalibacillus thermarum]|nr:hypothetical protein [Caldalkalibacillus thermarum]